MPRKKTKNLTLKFFFFSLMIFGVVATTILIQQPTFKSSRASEAAKPKLKETVRGAAGSGDTVSTKSSVKAAPATVYVASISMKPYREVTEVTGLGLTWNKVKSQCGGRNTSGAEVWVATGNPTKSGKVSARLEKGAENTVLAVSSFSGVDASTPVSNVYGVNTNGQNGSCNGGKDTESYSASLAAADNSLVFGTIATRLRTHRALDGWNEVLDYQFGSSNGDKAGIALVTKYNASAGKVKSSGSLNSGTDWAAVFVSLNGKKLSGNEAEPQEPTPVVSPSVEGNPPADNPGAPGNPQEPESTPPVSNNPVKGIWTSSEELSRIPQSGDAWIAVKRAADSLPARSSPNLDNQDDNTNVQVLAAAIVYARTGEASYKDKVVYALQQVEKFTPTGRTLAWGRETGAYAMAADLIGYRTPAFEKKMRDMAETYHGSQLNKPLLSMFKQRPNNWGFMAFSSLTAIYSYLGDTARLQEIRDYYIASVTGQRTEAVYGEKSWQCDPNNPRWINAPTNCVITCSGKPVDVSGVIPDDMRRGDSCRQAPVATGYPWEALQGLVVGARILERAGMPVWHVGDKAICRAASVLQEGRYGNSWKASGDDLWQLVFLDEACGTTWAAEAGAGKWESGKNAGWGFVTLH